MAAAILLVKFCENIYRKKSWYSTNFYPPDNYIKGFFFFFHYNLKRSLLKD